MTFVFVLENSGAAAVDLTAAFGNETPWNVIGDSRLSVPARSRRYYFPVTVQIPAGAPANQLKLIQVRLRAENQAFYGPPLTVTVLVQPFSQIDFRVPPPVAAAANTAVSYPVVLRNQGNTAEKINLNAVSEHGWPIRLSATALELRPGEAAAVAVTHRIPASPAVDSDRLTLTASWSAGQKEIVITTKVLEQSNPLTESHYLWNGQTGLFLASPFGSAQPLDFSFALDGPLSPHAAAEIRFNDLLDKTERHWHIGINSQPWTVKAGDFLSVYSGMVKPDAAVGRLYLARQDGDRMMALHLWQSAVTPRALSLPNAPPEDAQRGVPGDSLGDPLGGVTFGGAPFGGALEASWDPHNQWRFLFDPNSGAPLNVFEWSHWHDLSDSIRWSNSLAWNPQRLFGDDGGQYAAFVGLNRTAPGRNWEFGSQYDHHLNQSSYRFNNWLTLTQFLNEGRIYSNWQIKTDHYFDTITHTDLFIQGLVYIPRPGGTDYRLRASFASQNSANQNFDTRTDFYLEARSEAGAWKRDAALSASFENTPSASSYNSKLNWFGIYGLNQQTELILNPQLVLFQGGGQPDDFSQIAAGARWHGQPGIELDARFHHYLGADRRRLLELILGWELGPYELDLDYTGEWSAAVPYFNTVSLSVTRRFNLPVPKPLAAVSGVAFLDSNRNGRRDQDENTVGNLEFLITGARGGKQSFRTDADGRFQVSDVAPGGAVLSLPSEALYRLAETPLPLDVKPYQKARIDIPLIWTQNIAGVVYLDQNQDGRRNEAEPALAGIGLLLKDGLGHFVQQTVSDDQGRFIMYQLIPADYRLSVATATVPENAQIPPGLANQKITPSDLEAGAALDIGLLPYQKPIETVIPINDGLNIAPDQEIVSAGASLRITVSSSRPMQKMKLVLPGNIPVNLPAGPSQTAWVYIWQVPAGAPAGQAVIRCEAVDLKGRAQSAETGVIMLGTTNSANP